MTEAARSAGLEVVDIEPERALPRFLHPARIGDEPHAEATLRSLSSS